MSKSLSKTSNSNVDNDRIVFYGLINSKGQDLKSFMITALKKLLESSKSNRQDLIIEYELVNKTMNIIKERRGMDHIAIAILIAIASEQSGASILVDMGANKLILEMLNKSFLNERRYNYWFMDKSKESKALLYIIHMAQYQDSAIQMKELRAIESLQKLIDIGPQIAIDVALAIIHIEAASSYGSFKFPIMSFSNTYKNSYAFLQFTIFGIVSALDLTFRGLNGTNFTFGRYRLSTLVYAIKHLVKDEICCKIILNNAFNVVKSLFRLLQEFHEGGKSSPVIGGGVDDVFLAEAEIETLHSLLVSELERDNELCERLISRGLATLLISIYERKDSPLEPDEDGPKSLLRLSCWLSGHAGESLSILPRPGSSLKVGSLMHGDVVEVFLFYFLILLPPVYQINYLL